MPKWTSEQLEAIEKDGTNIIVSAGAGSGKTAVLSERVLNKLKKGIHVDELLILTFTRAAADEMKDRIRKKIAKDPSLVEELPRVDSAYITTFDSFSLSVLKKYHYLLNLTKDIEITDDSIVTIKKSEIMDEIFEENYINPSSNFVNLVNSYSVKDDSNIRSLVLNIANKVEGFLDKNAYLDYIENDFYKDENLDKYADEYINLVKEKQKEVSNALENLNYYFDGKYVDSVSNVVLPIINSDFEDLKNYKAFKLPSAPRGSEDEAKEAKAKLKSALDELFTLASFTTREELKENILVTKDYVLEIVNLIREYFEKLTDYKRKNNIFTFQDISNLSISLLKKYPKVREGLKNSFKEIMIDEYQDTNDIQDTFISMISDDNVYMVGDIKQSIYRFRGSNPNIFKDKYDNYSKNNGGYKIDLIKNFRSREEVLNNINEIFDLLMDDDLGGARYYESHEMVYGNHTYDDNKDDIDYNMSILEYDNPKESDYSNEEVEIFTIANDIKTKLNNHMKVFDKDSGKMRDATYNDFVIILDRSAYFDDFKKVFEYLGIPLTILKDGKLTNSDDIYIIKNIVDIIIRIKNKDFGTDFKYDFMSIGRSFLYEYSDEYIFEMLTEDKYKDSSIYKDFSNIDDYYSLTSSEIFTKILEITDFYNKIYKIGDYENINVRLDNINNLASNIGNLSLSFEDFRDYLNDIIEKGVAISYTEFSDSASSVKIMTIHKSKGLEYPVCYFADLDHDFNTQDVKVKFACTKKYGIITPTDSDSSVLKTLYKYDFIKEEISEKIRLFYVALTRAREKIVIVIPSKDTEKLPKNEYGTIELINRLKFKRLSNMIYSIKDYTLKYFKDVNIDNIGLTKNYLFKKETESIEDKLSMKEFKVKNNNIPYIEIKANHYSKETDKLLDKKTEDNMKFGTKMHEILEYTDFKNYDENKIENSFIRGKITKFLSNPLLKDIKNAEIYKEYEFTYEVKKTKYNGIIDLMLCYNDHVDIIDYKLKNTMDENYKKQLEGYRNYISSKTTKPVKTYLYSILNESLTEVN